MRTSRFRLKLLVSLAIVCWWQTPGGWPQEGSPARPKEPVANVAGQPIYEDDLLPQTAADLQQLRKQEFELKARALENLINQKVLEAEAGKKGITPDKLMEQEADSKLAEPTDAEIEAFYFGQKDRLNRPLEEVKAQLRDTLRQAKLQQARQNYLRGLWQRAGVAVFLSPPKLQISYDPARVRGGAKAAVVIIEFSDFECPF